MSKEAALATLNNIPTPPPTATPAEVGPNPAGEAKAPEAPKELESTRFAHLAKKESIFVKNQEKLKAERQAFEAERKKYVEAYERTQKFEELKAKSAREALQFAGFTDTDIVNIFAESEDKSTPEEKAARAAQAEIQKFKDEQATQAKAEQQKKNTQVIKQFKDSITSTLAADKEAFEYCNFHGAVAEELIFETVQHVLETSGELISAKEAAQMVEGYYEETDKAMSTLNKRKPKETAVEEAKQKVEALKPEMPGRSATTLTNKATATIAAATTTKKETPQEKRQRLIEQLGSLGRK
jgi:hypothetical protein